MPRVGDRTSAFASLTPTYALQRRRAAYAHQGVASRVRTSD